MTKNYTIKIFVSFTLLFLFINNILLADSTSVEVTFISNSGFMFSSGDNNIVIDALPLAGYYTSSEIEIANLEKLINLEPPFGDIDIILFTHNHSDHFHETSTIEHLKNNPEGRVIAPENVVYYLESGTDYDLVSDQIISVSPDSGEYKILEFDNMSITAYAVHHYNTWFTSYTHIAYYINLNGVKLFFGGDNYCEGEEYPAFRFDRYGIDIAFIRHLGFFGEEADKNISTLKNYINPKLFVPMHFLYGDNQESVGEIDSLVNEYNNVLPPTYIFRDYLESRVFRFLNPVAYFTADTTTGVDSLTVQFTDYSSGDISDWMWYFGDGDSSSQQNPVHKYEKAGIYSVGLKISNLTGSDMKIRQDYINIASTFPAAHFHADTTTGIDSLTVHFADSSTGIITDWLWDFGDGGESEEQNPVHTYYYGSHTVNLTVTGPNGTDTGLRENYIVVGASPPVANFGADTTVGPVPLSVQFTESSTGVIDDWRWHLGEGRVISDRNPSYTYNSAGEYNVRLSVYGPGGFDILIIENYITVLEPTEISDEITKPVSYKLYQNYPNPFNPDTRIIFDTPTHDYVKLAVYDILGNQVITLTDGYIKAGHHIINFDATGLISGVYLYKLESSSFSMVRKMLLVK